MKTLSVAGSAYLVLATCSLMAACGIPGKKDTRRPLYEVVKPRHVPTSVAVTIAQMKFKPERVRVHRGDTVVFTNNDVVEHDATALPDSAWASGPLQPGDSWKWIADSTSEYFCSIHVVMRGVVLVD